MLCCAAGGTDCEAAISAACLAIAGCSGPLGGAGQVCGCPREGLGLRRAAVRRGPGLWPPQQVARDSECAGRWAPPARSAAAVARSLGLGEQRAARRHARVCGCPTMGSWSPGAAACQKVRRSGPWCPHLSNRGSEGYQGHCMWLFQTCSAVGPTLFWSCD